VWAVIGPLTLCSVLMVLTINELQIDQVLLLSTHKVRTSYSRCRKVINSMRKWNSPVEGKFHDGLIKNKNHPPVLAVELKSKTRFDWLMKTIDSQQFLRVRRVAEKYKTIVINTIGDATEKGGVINHNTCLLNTTINITEPKEKEREKLDNAPIWSLLFFYRDEDKKPAEKFFVAVDKETEEIVQRNHVQAK